MGSDLRTYTAAPGDSNHLVAAGSMPETWS
jgi:hypothetical protein